MVLVRVQCESWFFCVYQLKKIHFFLHKEVQISTEIATSSHNITTLSQASPLTNWVIIRQGTQNSFLGSSLPRQDHRLNPWALTIKGPSPATLNVFRSYKVLPLESITSFNDSRSKKRSMRRRGWLTGEKGARGFTVTKCRGQAGCVAAVLISEACSAQVARTLTLK